MHEPAAVKANVLYTTIWRWHFYAGLIVAPFAVLLAITGALYLFQAEIEGWLYRDLFSVLAAPQSLPPDKQVAIALAKFPGSAAEAYTPASSASQSTLVRLATPDGRELTVAINPHTGAVLGEIDEARRFNHVIFYLHGELLSGPAGQAVMELAASWALVLLVTGLYLAWPRDGSIIFGVLLPRLRAQGRVFWRDLHAVTGIWVSALLIFLVVTGLPWSLVDGTIINDLAADIGKGTPDNGLGFSNGGSTSVKSDPVSQGWAATHAEHAAGAAASMPHGGTAPVSLAQIVEMTRLLDDVTPPYEIRLPVDAQGVFTVVNNPDDPAKIVYIHLDQFTGKVIRAVRWQDFGPLAKGISLGVALHEGRYFGLANQLIGLAACVGLVAMVTAGIIMWWRRRPPGGLGAPASDGRVRPGRAVVALTVALAVLMPLMGLSLIIILAVEYGLRRVRVISTAALFLIAILLSPDPSRAQSSAPAQGPSDQTYRLDEIVVTASRSEQFLSSVPASISVVGSDQIRQTSAQELDEVLRLVPGIDLLGYSGEAQHPTSDAISMRGLGGGAQSISRALVMVDGVPINDAFFGDIQWGRVPLENIDHVEIVRGGGSPLWGNYAEGGVINIITREPSKQEAIFDAGGGNYSTYRVSGYGAYLPDGIMKFQGFASVDGTGGYQQVPDFERAPFNIPTSYRAINLQFKNTIQPSNDLIGHITVNYHNNNQQLETVLDKNSQDIVNLSGDIKKRFADDGALTATAFYSNSGFSTNNSTYFPVAGALATTTQSLNEIHHVDANDAGGSLIWSQDLAGMLKNYLVGMDFHYITGIDHTDHFIAPDFTPSFFQTTGHGDQTFTAGFVKGTLSPIEKLDITASGRFQYLVNSNGFDGSVGGAGAVPDSHYTSFTPRVDVRYALTDEVALRGAYYRSFRAPNIGDQFYAFAAGGFAFLPAPNLKPEKLHGGEIGLDYTWQRLRSQFTLYRTNIDNYIVAEPTVNPVFSPLGYFVVQNMNVAAVQAQGFETEVNWDIGGGFSTNLAYTFADSVVKNNPADPLSVGKQLIDVPRHRVGTSLTYKDRAGWTLSTQMFWVSRTAWASPDHTDPGYPGKIAADSHFLVDVSGSYQITERIETYVKLQNLFNRRYVATSYSAPSAQTFGAPFTVFSGIRVSF